MKNFHNLSSILTLLVWLILGTYCLIAFFPIPSGIGIGLDPSWQYALSRVAQDKLIFGRDIIITYGPLGYLVHGAAWTQNFFSIFVFRFVVHVVLLGLAFVKILQIKANVQKILLFLSLLFIYILNLSSDYEILFAFLILFSLDIISRGEQTKFWFLGLGALSGFCLLTKFTLGVCIFTSLLLVSLTNLFSSIKGKSSILNSSFALLNLLLTSTTISFIFLNPNRILSTQKILICLVISGLIGLTAWLIQNLLHSHKVSRFARTTVLKYRKLRWRLTSWISFYAAYSICLLSTIFYASPSLIDYLKSSLEISSGYSSGMSIVGSPWEVGFAISEVILIFILLIKIASEKSLGFSLSLAFVLWVTFKHGFVRQDLHVLNFISSTPLIVALCIAKSKKIRELKLAFYIHTYVLTIALVYCLIPKPFGQQVPENIILHNLNFANIVGSKASALIDIQQLSNAIDANSRVNLANVKLPQRVTSLLKDKKVDIVPWEISLVEANELNWQPRPIFQSYSAYTSFLDRKNSESILREPRDYIIYQFLSIDGRHPFFDEPETFFNILCNYGLSSDVPNFVNTPSVSNLIILEKRKSSMCSTGSLGKKFSMRWNNSQDIEASDGFLVRAAVNLKYSSFGKIYKTLFRIPPVMLNVTYMNGSKGSYRIIPENSNNGVIVSHLPQNDSQALALFQGHFTGNLYNTVKSFSFSTSNSLLYKPNIDLSFTSYNIYVKPKV